MTITFHTMTIPAGQSASNSTDFAGQRLVRNVQTADRSFVFATDTKVTVPT